MKYTKNYHLPQWVKEDRIMMKDFNDAMSSIESGITNVQAAADSAKSAAGNAQSAAAAAQDAADAAKSAASAAQSTADTARTEAAVLPYAAGSYVGSHDEQTIVLGFRPSFVVIFGSPVSGTTYSFQGHYYVGATAGTVMTTRCRLDDNGFTVFPAIVEQSAQYPHLNSPNMHYDYIAFR